MWWNLIPWVYKLTWGEFRFLQHWTFPLRNMTHLPIYMNLLLWASVELYRSHRACPFLLGYPKYFIVFCWAVMCSYYIHFLIDYCWLIRKLLIFLCCFFWPQYVACRTSPTWDEPMAPAVEAQNLNHWTTRETPIFYVDSWGTKIISNSFSSAFLRFSRPIMYVYDSLVSLFPMCAFQFFIWSYWDNKY